MVTWSLSRIMNSCLSVIRQALSKCQPTSESAGSTLQQAIEPWAKIIEYWRLSEVPIRPGVQPSQVAEFQRKYAVTIPRDVLEYLETVDGSSSDFMDSDCYRFWPLSEIRPVHEVLDDSTGVIYPDRFLYPDCFVFSDYLIDCWLYAVKFTGDPSHLRLSIGWRRMPLPESQWHPHFGNLWCAMPQIRRAFCRYARRVTETQAAPRLSKRPARACTVAFAASALPATYASSPFTNTFSMPSESAIGFS